MVIPNFVNQALTGKPITDFGDGSQTRSFAYVGDVVQAVLSLLKEPSAVGQVFNIGNDREISILDLARTVKRLTGSDSEIRTIPYEKAYEAGFEDMPRRVPDLRKIKTLLGWTPTVTLEELLAKILSHVGQEESK